MSAILLSSFLTKNRDLSWMFPSNLQFIEWATTLHQEVASKTSTQDLTSTHIEYRLTTLQQGDCCQHLLLWVVAKLVPFNEQKIQVQHSSSCQSSVTYLFLISSG